MEPLPTRRCLPQLSIKREREIQFVFKQLWEEFERRFPAQAAQLVAAARAEQRYGLVSHRCPLQSEQ